MATIDEMNAQYAQLEQWRNAWGDDPTVGRNYDAQMQALVAQRDQLAAEQASENDAWHRAHGTGKYASGGSGSSSDQDQDRFEAQQRQQRESASAFLRNVLAQYGLGSLAGSVDSLIQQWGSNTDVIALKLKDTGEYKTRFKGLLGLQQKGVTDVSDEAEYLRLESAYRQVFREAGLTSFLGDAGTQAEYDKIADIVAKHSLSVNEVRDRVSDAQRVAANTPKEVRDAFRDFYGVDATQLVEYSLDPAGTAERINRQANAAVAAGLARQQGLNVGQGTGELIAGNYGENDLNQGQVMGQLQDALATRDSTGRLAQIEQGSLSDDEATQASMGLSEDARKKVRGLQSRERARFGGSSAFSAGSLSNTAGL